VRYTRQALKQDRFAETAADAMHWTVEHRSKMINGGIAVAAILIVFLGAFWYTHHREVKATEELGQALMTYQAPLRPPAIPADPQQPSFSSVQERAIAAGKQFNQIASDYGSTKSGKFAKYFAGLAAIDAGNEKVGEEHLKYVAGLRDKDVSSLAKVALAALYRDTNREADAVNIYKELIEHPTDTVPKVTSQLQLAELYAPKQSAEARKIYQEVAKENPQSPAGQLATEKVQELK
jgi:predicted negative regulator of RcsB-dependent stress response